MTHLHAALALASGFRRPVSALVALVLVGTAIPAIAAVENPTGDAKLMARLTGGEVISRITETGPTRSVQVMGLINHPASAAFRVFTDYPRRPAIYNTTKKVEVRKADARNPQIYYLMGFPWPIGDRWVHDSEQLEPDSQHMTWRMLKGNVNTYSGEAQFFPVGAGKCVLSFQAQADPNISVIPAWLMAQVQRLLLPAVVTSLGRYMDSGRHHH
ncbi:MAG: SRPBCC family protein [Candidatus Sericytochromatia bacterium]|nr:SRPBCC family protein [Candidatus Sericytochromatia bacterium]